jgi:lipid A 4'-phosphatase
MRTYLDALDPRARRLATAIACTHALGAIGFALFPEADLAVSGWFADGPRGFLLPRHPALDALLVAVDVIAWTFLIGATLGWIGYRWRGTQPVRRRTLLTLVLALLIGPGLIVNVALKDNWGRARPRDVAEFGGTRTFTPALQPADQCRKNCSFSSGHAAAGYFPIVAAAVDPRRARLWLAVGTAGGLGVGGARVLVGAHFASDVLFSFWATVAGGWIAFAITSVRSRPLRRDSSEDHP